MLKSYLLIALRTLARNKVYTFVSTIGLAVGIASTLLIVLYIVDELSYDQHHENKERIYRITSILDFNGEMDVALTSMALGPSLCKEYPEVQNYVRFRSAGANTQMRVEQKVFNETNVWFTDSTIFDVFSYDFISGSAEDGLKRPNTVVLSESTALKYFGNVDVIGERVKLNNTSLEVVGVIKEPSNNSEVELNMLISMSTLPESFHQTFNQDWFRVGFYTFLLFDRPVDEQAFEEKLVEFEERNVQPWSQSNEIEAGHTFFITGLEDLHFDDRHDYDLPKGNSDYISIFSALALFLLLIATINYINLNLAQGNKRSLEVGIRKTLGGNTNDIRIQHLIESFLVTLFASAVALMLFNFALEPFNQISGKAIQMNAIFELNILWSFLLIIVIVSLLSGLYPAFILSSFQPATVLKGGNNSGRNIGFFRKGLILIQFVFSSIMIIGTFLVNDQMEYIYSKELGFDKDNVVTFRLPSDTTINRKSEVFIDEIKQSPSVQAVCRSSMPTGSTGELMFRVEIDNQLVEKTVKTVFVDYDFINVLDLNIIKGRNFSKAFSTDPEQAFIINQKAADVFGWNEDPLGKRIQWGLMPDGQAANDGKVVGIVNDFHFLSLHNEMEPIILCLNTFGSQNLSVRLISGNQYETLDYIQSKWQQMAEAYPFEPVFLNDQLEDNYIEEKNMQKVFKFFAIISIIVASMGLFAMLSYSIENREKEIGVRKILGASTLNIIWIVAQEFFTILMIAFFISAPLTYIGTQRWLDDYAYKAPLQFQSYIIALLIVIAMSVLAVCYHGFKLAVKNPLHSLQKD